MVRGRDVVLRTFRASDYAPVLRLWKRTGLLVGPSDEEEELARSLRRDPELFVVAESAGRIVGAVLGRFDGRRGWVNHLAVDPRLQRHGLGRNLLEELERRLVRKGCLKVNLHIERPNRAVAGFYLRVGYARRPLLFLEKWLERAPPPARRTRGRPSRRARRPSVRA